MILFEWFDVDLKVYIVLSLMLVCICMHRLLKMSLLLCYYTNDFIQIIKMSYYTNDCCRLTEWKLPSNQCMCIDNEVHNYAKVF